MDPTKAVIVICVTLFIVIGINAAIYVSLRRGNEIGQIDLIRRAADTAQKPWQVEDQALKELSTLVSKLNEVQHPEDKKPDDDEK